MRIVEKDIKELKPYKNNPRNNDNAVDAVAASIKEFGFKVPIVIDRNNEIVAGHTRYRASLKLGLATVPCIVADDLNEEQIKAFRLADNKTGELAEWDIKLLNEELMNISMDMLQFGFEDEAEEKEAEEDDYEVILPPEPKTKYGEIYQLGRHYVMCGDTTKKDDVNLLMNHVDIDLVVTDPPYNVDYGSKADTMNKYGYGFTDRRIQNDFMPELQFIEFLADAFQNTAAVMRQGAAYYIFHASITQMEFETALRMNNMKTRQQIIWVKNALVIGRQDYQWKHEPCLYGWKEGAAHYFTFERTLTTVFEDNLDLDKMKKEDMKALLKQYMEAQNPETIVRENKPTKSSEHPTMKPIKLLANFIRNSSKPTWRVFDPFGGSGSTLIACEQLDRVCYTIELDPKYVDVIIDRWEKFTGQKAKLIHGSKENE